jgi:dihydrofolate reductase
MHTSLDGFTTDRNGKMDWIKVDEEIFDYAGRMTDQSDTALYGRVTYQMMDAYWPTAADKPDASRHDKEHSVWYNKVQKVVLSKTMTSPGKPDVRIINDHPAEEIQKIKKLQGKNIVMFGSPSAGHSLMQYHLIDEFWLFVNPVLLGKGIPMFKNIANKKLLSLVDTKIFNCGVLGLHYIVES